MEATLSLSKALVFSLLRSHLTREESPCTGATLEQWQEAIKYAVAHRVVLLLYTHLKSHPQDVPESILLRLKRLYRINAADNLRLEKELQTIIAMLAAENIPCMPIKGIVLSYLLYEDPAIRPVVDLDILVQPHHLDRVLDLLLARGYAWTVHADRMRSRWYRRISHHVALIHQERRIILEVHGKLVQPNRARPVAGERIWQRALKWHLGDYEYEGLSLEDLTAYLVSHSAKEYFGSVLQIHEIAVLLLRQQPGSWRILWQRAAEHHCRRRLKIYLALMRQAFALDLTPPALLALVPELAQPLTRREKSLLQVSLEQLLGQDTEACRTRPLKLWYDFWIADNPVDRLVVLWHKVRLVLVKLSASLQLSRVT